MYTPKQIIKESELLAWGIHYLKISNLDFQNLFQ